MRSIVSCSLRIPAMFPVLTRSYLSWSSVTFRENLVLKQINVLEWCHLSQCEFVLKSRLPVILPVEWTCSRSLYTRTSSCPYGGADEHEAAPSLVRAKTTGRITWMSPSLITKVKWAHVLYEQHGISNLWRFCHICDNSGDGPLRACWPCGGRGRLSPWSAAHKHRSQKDAHQCVSGCVYLDWLVLKKTGINTWVEEVWIFKVRHLVLIQWRHVWNILTAKQSSQW